MIVKDEVWNNIPLLHIVKEQYATSNVPVAIFLHGFTSAKEHNLHYAFNLAKKGIRVLLPDAHLHGVRDENIDEVELGLRFWEIVLTSIEEVGFIREELVKRKLATTQKVGLGGTSMGGITTLGCLTAYKWINSAMIMMGSPNYVGLAKAQIKQFERGGFKLPVSDEDRENLFDNLAKFDISKHPSALNQRPIYFWHGQMDTVVPYKPTYDFYVSVKKDYAAVPERLVFVADNEVGHKVTRPGMLAAVNWLAGQLKD